MRGGSTGPYFWISFHNHDLSFEKLWDSGSVG
jgi:hypothetical protein